MRLLYNRILYNIESGYIVYVDNSIIFSIQSPLLSYGRPYATSLPYSPTPNYTITIQPDLILTPEQIPAAP
ncbi:MAG: hypothetical protein F6K40_15400 [Okeania sp. SIO3I5]|uniref:hypothetical protein n=1 Tax=Okeania sp. SIO3I5 TaxID=2607805 RepID=UPI0013BB197B|nr:hypothetical protein [Okeania sp. SIO3I5]NEQ37578.1 hypothetical protein [Okeania sp. SIO3I5]